MDSAQLLDHLGASGNAGSRLQAHLHAAVAFGSESQVMFAFKKLTKAPAIGIPLSELFS